MPPDGRLLQVAPGRHDAATRLGGPIQADRLDPLAPPPLLLLALLREERPALLLEREDSRSGAALRLKCWLSAFSSRTTCRSRKMA
jgi:hypothetical protein